MLNQFGCIQNEEDEVIFRCIYNGFYVCKFMKFKYMYSIETCRSLERFGKVL